MGVPVPICHSLDMAVGVTTHQCAPGPSIVAGFELPAVQAWPPGIGLGTVKKTSDVFYQGWSIILAGHDCGKLVPQVTVPPANALLPVILLTASRKTIFSCFSVRMNGKPTACMSTLPLPLPSLSCGKPVPWPLTFTVTNMVRHVFVGMTFADYIGGVISTAGAMAIELLAGGASDNAKALLGAACQGAATAVQHAMDPRYPISAEVKLGLPGGIDLKVGVSCGSSDTANNPSQVSVGIEKSLWKGFGVPGQKGTDLAKAKAGASGTYTWDAGGDKSKEGFQGQGGAEAGSPVAGAKVGGTVDDHPQAANAADRSKVGAQASVASAVGSASSSAESHPAQSSDIQTKTATTGAGPGATSTSNPGPTLSPWGPRL